MVANSFRQMGCPDTGWSRRPRRRPRLLRRDETSKFQNPPEQSHLQNQQIDDTKIQLNQALPQKINGWMKTAIKK